MKTLLYILGFSVLTLPGAGAAHAGKAHKITGDFNGDGLIGDTARLEMTADGTGSRIIIKLAGDDSEYSVEPTDLSANFPETNMLYMQGVKLRAVPPGGNRPPPCGYLACNNKLTNRTQSADSIALYTQDRFFTTYIYLDGDRVLTYPKHNITGDFNGDGIAGDSVRFRPGADGQGYTLVARFAGNDGDDGDDGSEPVSPHEHVLSHMDHLHYTGLQSAPPGAYENPCTRGVYESCVGMLESITTSSDSAIIYKEEAYATMLVWHSDTGGFLRHPLSD